MTALATSSHVGDGARSMSFYNFFELRSYFVQGLIPGNAFKAISNSFERILQPFRVILKIHDARAFSAKVSLRTRIRLVTPHFDDLAAFCDDLQAAVLAAQNTTSFFPVAHDSLSPSIRTNSYMSIFSILTKFIKKKYNQAEFHLCEILSMKYLIDSKRKKC
jgi:sulfite exporter TauE/SafE